MVARIGAISLEHSLHSWTGIMSGPGPICGLLERNRFSIPFSLTI